MSVLLSKKQSETLIQIYHLSYYGSAMLLTPPPPQMFLKTNIAKPMREFIDRLFRNTI